MRVLFVAAALAIGVSSAVAQAPEGTPTRIRGTVEKLEGQMLEVKTRAGQTVRIALGPSFVVSGVVKRSLSDLKPGDLAVTVEFGGQRTDLTLEPQFEVGEWGTPGDYRAAFIPTQPGKYTFVVKGTVDGENTNFSMTSGPKTFSEVEDTASAMFPAENAPSTTDLATRIDQETARTTADIASAHDAADSARTMAIIAGVVAVLAVVVAIVAVARSRRSSTA